MNILINTINDKLLRHLMIVVVIYVPLSFIITFFTHTFLSLMLGWNVILAFIPVGVAFLFKIKINEEDSLLNRLTLITLFMIWLFFFPNSFYLITDFIHLGGEEFYYSDVLYSPIVYTENIIGYLILIHIFLGAFVSIFMACYSLKIINDVLFMKSGKVLATLYMMIIFMLSSIGIYIGRFLRLQSWDIINPFYVIKSFIDSLDVFTIQFIFLFIVIQILLYYFLRPFIKVSE